MEHATRWILHANVTVHPIAGWTLPQLREAIPADHIYRFLLHDRDEICSQALDQRVRHLELCLLKTPVRSPQANALCERLLGTLRRECLDFVIPLTEHHLRHILHEWVDHDNTGRPHMALGPGILHPPVPLPVPLQGHKHRLPEPSQVVAHPIVGGLYHEYQLLEKAAWQDDWTRTSEVHIMATPRLVVPGIVKNGLVVPQNDTPLPEGAHVDILMGPTEMTPELRAELAQWEQASDEAWTMIDRWEADDR